MGDAATIEYVRSSPALDGQRLGGISTGPRDAFWPVAIHAGMTDWKANQERFWRSLIPGEYGLWTVTHDGVSRSLECRYAPDAGKPYTFDPSQRGIEVAGISLIADKPFWRGPLSSKVFQTAADTGTFYAPPGSNFVFTIGSASTVDGATISNPGDTPAWPTLTVYGPAVSFSINVGGSVISATLSLAAGESLVIDTNPTVQVARKWVAGVGTIVPFFNFSSIQFAQIPRGGSVPVDIVLNGAGSVQVAFFPQYRRAF